MISTPFPARPALQESQPSQFFQAIGGIPITPLPPPLQVQTDFFLRGFPDQIWRSEAFYCAG